MFRSARENKIDPAFEIFSSKQTNCLLCQVSGSKLWETERSCMCCQESGEREATVSLFCPNAPPDQPKIRKVFTIDAIWLGISKSIKFVKMVDRACPFQSIQRSGGVPGSSGSL